MSADMVSITITNPISLAPLFLKDWKNAGPELNPTEYTKRTRPNWKMICGTLNSGFSAPNASPTNRTAETPKEFPLILTFPTKYPTAATKNSSNSGLLARSEFIIIFKNIENKKGLLARANSPLQFSAESAYFLFISIGTPMKFSIILSHS